MHGPDTAASSTAGRTSRIPRTRNKTALPRLRTWSFHPAIWTRRGCRTVVTPPPEAPPRPREPRDIKSGAETVRDGVGGPRERGRDGGRVLEVYIHNRAATQMNGPRVGAHGAEPP